MIQTRENDYVTLARNDFKTYKTYMRIHIDDQKHYRALIYAAKLKDVKYKRVKTIGHHFFYADFADMEQALRFGEAVGAFRTTIDQELKGNIRTFITQFRQWKSKIKMKQLILFCLCALVLVNVYYVVFSPDTLTQVIAGMANTFNFLLMFKFYTNEKI